jgi:hypothetical protein
VLARFSDGILRVEIGKGRSGVTRLIVDLIEKLDPNAPAREMPAQLCDSVEFL